jgi:RNA polymerase sigma-32 factor
LSLTGPKGRADEADSRTLGESLADDTVDVEDSVVHADLLQTVDSEMKAFASGITDERERAIWDERMIAEEPISLAELGERYNVSRERVRQIESRLKKRLKEFLTERLGESLVLDFNAQD